MKFTKEMIGRMMDHAVLKPNCTDEDIRKNAEACMAHGIGNLCVRPTDVAYAKELLQGSPVTVACVLGFPHGASRSETKALETRLAIEDGADEVDMVMNVGKLLSGDLDFVKNDIAAVVAVAKPKQVLVKVILETCLLSPGQIAQACELAIAAGADFVKTSTGFNGDGASVEAVQIMLDTVKGRARVKPSGGIRDWHRAVMFAEMGVHRLGVGSGPQILDGAPVKENY
ncbi:MAG: deoxyribose-phosphate aldolase [Verrucomicrobia bacterium]|nr:deoxyribose-phosphate aldolase [Verrucomicrobiota bacterium]